MQMTRVAYCIASAFLRYITCIFQSLKIREQWRSKVFGGLGQ